VSSRPMSPCSSKIPIENKENELWRDVNPRKSGVLFRQSRTLIWLVLLASSCAYGQCTLWNQSTCSSLYSFNANPSLATFLADVEASFQAIDAAVAAMPQPKIVVTAQILPASGAWISTAPQMFGPAINGYMDLLKTSAGVTTQDVNLWPSVLSSAAQYAPAAGDIAIPSDCGGSVTIGTGVSAPPGTSPNARCMALTYYDSMFGHAAANGITMRVGFFPNGDTIAACGLSPAPATFTESQYEHCMIPLIKAAMSRWTTAITAVQVFEEPVAGMSSVQVFSVADVGTFIRNSSAAVKAIVPGAFVGAAATGISYPPSLDTPYWDDWANGTTTPASLDFLVIDYFGGSCVQSGNYYYSEAVWYAANFLSRAANIHGKPVRIGQSDHPVWCPAGGSSEQRYAYLGAGDVIWQTSGMQTTWQSTMIRWASAAGLQSFAMYCTLPLFNYTANQSQDNCSTGAYSGLAMSQLSPTDAAAAYKSSAQWPTESIQGNTHLAGRASLGH
jgi:hypothetical protein